MISIPNARIGSVLPIVKVYLCYPVELVSSDLPVAQGLTYCAQRSYALCEISVKWHVRLNLFSL